MSQESNKLKTIATVVVVLLVAGGAYFYWNWTKEKSVEYLASPQVGDVYRYEQENGLYSDYKVIELTEEPKGVVVYENQYEHPDKYGDLGVAYFEDDESRIPFTLEELQALWDTGVVYHVRR